MAARWGGYGRKRVERWWSRRGERGVCYDFVVAAVAGLGFCENVEYFSHVACIWNKYSVDRRAMVDVGGIRDSWAPMWKFLGWGEINDIHHHGLGLRLGVYYCSVRRGYLSSISPTRHCLAVPHLTLFLSLRCIHIHLCA